jgi:hypothetical protein
MMRPAMTVALWVIAGAACFVLWVRWSEPRMLYYPVRGIGATPADRGWRYEEVRLVASDGVRLHAWHVSAGHAAGAGPRLAVLFLHGNAGNRSDRLEKLAVLRDLGVDVLIVDYRGYGGSGGKPDERGTYRDADAAYRWLVEVRGLDPRSVVLYGESLGSAVAVELAARAQAGGLVLEEAFTSVPDVARSLYPFLPVGRLIRNRYDALAKIGRVRAPILLLHSRDDEYFPMSHARRLAAAARQATVVELRGGHNDAFLVSAPVWRRALEEFVGAVAERR